MAYILNDILCGYVHRYNKKSMCQMWMANLMRCFVEFGLKVCKLHSRFERDRYAISGLNGYGFDFSVEQIWVFWFQIATN